MEKRSAIMKKAVSENKPLKKQQQQQQEQSNENSLTSLLRTLLRQKETDAERLRGENERLKKLLVKQQSLLNKLNEDNLILANSQHHISTCCLSPASHDHDEEIDGEDEIVNSSLKQECANYESLREQLLVAQNYGARLLKELNEAKQNMKLMSKLLVKS